MQRIVLLVILLLGIGFIFTKSINKATEAHPAEELQEDNKRAVLTTQAPAKVESISEVERSVFVPYWSLQNTEGLSEYDSVIYFGISVNSEGVNRSDQGFTNMQSFVNSVPTSETYLTVRMLDTETNLEILESNEAQKKVIADVISITQEYGFDGVVLDLELSVIPFTDVKENISMFMTMFSEELEAQDLVFNITLYGDTYYRSRPYDVKKLGAVADNVYIMAYDFHKSRGEPGPNFPFSGQKTYGYDFQQMIHDFSKDIPVEKLTVIFGMYGYDWTLGSQGMPLTSATAFSLADAQEGFVPNCNYTSCVVQRDSESKEMKGTYIDEERYKHEIWFEDDESVKIKTEYIKEQGIDSVIYWTWGYW